MLMSLRAQTVLSGDRVLYSLEDGFVSATKIDNVHPYSNVDRILLLCSSRFSRSPSTLLRLLILSGLPKHHPFNQPMMQRPLLLALQQRLSQYLLNRSQILPVPLLVRRLVEDGLGRYRVLLS